MNEMRLLVSFGAVFVLLLTASAGLVLLLDRWVLASRQLRSPALRAGLVLAPPIIALLGCVALAFPDPFEACHCAAHGLHHPHLCLTHPAFAGSLFVPASCLVAAWAALVAPRLGGLGRRALASSRWVRSARRLPIEQLEGVAVHLLDDASPSAFMAGVLAPIIAMDRRLWAALSPEARRAVVHHERAHTERRDGLTLFALQLAAAVSPFPLGSRLLDGWKAAAESACDRHAAWVLGDAGAIAEALIAVEKTRAAHPGAAAEQRLVLGIGAGGELERRVLALLEREDASRARELLGNDLLAVALVALAAGTLTLAWPGGAFHHAVETAIGLLAP